MSKSEEQKMYYLRFFPCISLKIGQFGLTSILKELNIHYYGHKAFSDTDQETLKIILYLLKMFYWTSLGTAIIIDNPNCKALAIETMHLWCS